VAEAPLVWAAILVVRLVVISCVGLVVSGEGRSLEILVLELKMVGT
jgi:hypothetical protein